jgi:hypothetical protein
MPTPSDPVASTAAIPLDAVPGDAVAAGPEAVPEAAVNRGTTTDQLCILADDTNISNPAMYSKQFFNIAENKVVVVSSWQRMMDEIFKYSKIETLFVVSHGFAGEILLGGAQKTLDQWANGKLEDTEEPFVGLATFPGSIGTLHIEGCSVGADPEALLSFKQKVRVTRVEAWSMFRYLELYVRTVTGDAAASVQQYRASGEGTRASPYLPKGQGGDTYKASELESKLLQASKFEIFAEIFGNDLPFGGTQFVRLVEPNPPFTIDPNKHFARSQAITERVRTPQEAIALKGPDKIGASMPVLYRVIAE